MSRTLGTRTSVGVHVYATSTVYVANEALRTQIELVGMRGLDNQYITSNLQTISKGYQTWVTTGDLRKAILEIYDPRTDKAVERWDMCFNYDTNGTGDPSQFKTEMAKLKEFASKLHKLPPGCKYRVVVELNRGAPPVQGWEYATLLNIDHLKRHSLGDYIDTAKVNVYMEYWGKT